MSLINDVLKDLEKRQSAQPVPRQTPATPAARSGRGTRLIWWLGIAVVAGVALHWGLKTQTPEPDPSAPVQASMPELRTQPEPVPVPPHEGTNEEATVETPSVASETSPGDTSEAVAGAEQTPWTSRSAPDSSEPSTVVEPEPVSPPATAEVAQPEPGSEPNPAPERASENEPAAPQAGHSVAAAPRQEPEQSADTDITIRRAGETSAPDADDEIDAARRAMARQQYRNADRHLRSLLEREPGHDEARLLLANSLIRRGEGRTAVNVLDAGLGHSADPAEIARLLGRVLIDRGETARAREVLAAHAPDPLSDPDYHQLLAAAHRQAGDHEAALDSYRRLAEIVPGRGAVWIGLGASLEALDQPDQAGEAYTRALETDDPRAVRFARQRLNAINSSDRGR